MKSQFLEHFQNKFFLKIPLFILFIGVIQLTCFSILIAEQPDYSPKRLQHIHSKLKLLHGSLFEEYDEQLMIAMYLPEDAKVLEIGGNFGRTACVIASILNHPNDFVTVEPNIEYAKLLQQNQACNGLRFHIETAAISKVPLVQCEWKSVPSEVNSSWPFFKQVNIISFDDLQKKYGIEFDTLVIDCEGAFYYTLRDDPEILKNIKMVIIENDFDMESHMQYVHDLFRKYGLHVAYNKVGPVSSYPGYHCFFQVWKK